MRDGAREALRGKDHLTIPRPSLPAKPSRAAVVIQAPRLRLSSVGARTLALGGSSGPAATQLGFLLRNLFHEVRLPCPISRGYPLEKASVGQTMRRNESEEREYNCPNGPDFNDPPPRASEAFKFRWRGPLPQVGTGESYSIQVTAITFN